MALRVALKRHTGHFKTDIGVPFYSGKIVCKIYCYYIAKPLKYQELTKHTCRSIISRWHRAKSLKYQELMELTYHPIFP